ncbi:MAG: hypothetical protein OEU46_14095 [Alphaproteobacteria bacterium]|nr:hypothetical protein [Alphaproteobacteria bacterium]
MGLDWLPGNKPKPGFEPEFKQIFDKLTEPKDGTSSELPDEEKNALEERFFEISISAFETLQAPVVGQDAAADNWAREFRRSENPDFTEEQLENALREAAGYRVLDLLPPCDGIPVYSNAPMGHVEAYSFRAEFLTDCAEIIGETLLDRAYLPMMPDEFLAYGRDLLGKAEDYASRHGLDIDNLDTEDADGIQFQVHVVLSAGRWCVYWAEREHWMEAYW